MTDSPRPGAWLLRSPGPRPAPGAALRLYCFPYAGGSPAAYLPWQARLGAGIEVCAVQLPGRGGRFNEAPCTSLEQLVATLVQVIAREPAQPFAFFGHSLGGLVAYEVARALAAGGHAQPCHLLVSGCAAPRYRRARPAIHLYDDATLLRELERYAGTPPELLANAELMALLLPGIRADFALVHDYAWRPGMPLHQPLTVLAGDADAIGPGIELTGWQEESSALYKLHWFAGGHFFIHERSAEVLDCIQAALQPLTEPAF